MEQKHLTDSPFDGKLDGVAIYDKPLSDKEIAQLFKDCRNMLVPKEPWYKRWIRKVKRWVMKKQLVQS